MEYFRIESQKYKLLSLTQRKNAVKSQHTFGSYEALSPAVRTLVERRIEKAFPSRINIAGMLENQNTPVLRKNILMKLWGDDSFFNTRNLDVYITRLRDCLKKDRRIEMVTIKGIGYNFV